MDWQLPWQRICDVDPAPLAAWLAGASTWLPNPSQIDRVWDVPADLSGPIIAAVLSKFEQPVRADAVCLNRVNAGVIHGMHYDGQGANWLTRVHVPLTTNPGCWHLFEVENARVHFEVGGAYSFNTELRHCFGNEGDSARVNLVFDVYRA